MLVLSGMLSLRALLRNLRLTEADPYGFGKETDVRIIGVSWADSEDGIDDILTLTFNHTLPPSRIRKMENALAQHYVTVSAEILPWKGGPWEVTCLTLHGPVLPQEINAVITLVKGEDIRFDERAVHGKESRKRPEDPFGFADESGLRVLRAEWDDSPHAWSDRLRLWLSQDVSLELVAHLEPICRRQGLTMRVSPASGAAPCRVEIEGLGAKMGNPEVKMLFNGLGISFRVPIRDRRRLYDVEFDPDGDMFRHLGRR